MEARPTHVVLTSIAGVAVTWVTDCRGEADELCRVLKYHLRKPEEIRGQEEHTVEFVQTPGPTMVPPDSRPVWEGPYMGLTTSRNNVCWVYSPSANLDYLILTAEIAVIHDPAAHHTRCELLSREKDGRWIRPRIWDAMVIILHTVMSMHGRYSLHSAAVGIDGKAHVFLGESGHGKSTLCTDLAKRGADFMGDDLTFLYLADGEVRAGSLLMEAKLFPSRKAKEKDWVDVVATTGCAAPLSLPVGGIYYVSRAKGPCRFESREAIDCMIALIRASNNVRMQYDKDRWQQTYEVASVGTRFRLFHFGDRKTLSKELFRDV